MPTNKNAQLRLRIIDECLQKRSMTKQNIMDELNDFDKHGYELAGSSKTFFNDLNVLREMIRKDYVSITTTDLGWDTYYDEEGRVRRRRNIVYHYTERGYSAFGSDLTIEEVDRLHRFLTMLDSHRGPANPWLEDVVNSLEVRYGLKPNASNVVGFGDNEQLQGLMHLSGLIDVTTRERTISLQYKTYAGATHNHILYPYYLKRYNNRWFLFGRTDGYDTISVFALDRIVSFHEYGQRFQPNTVVDFQTYFDDIIGVTKVEDEPLDICLRFSEQRFRYVVTKPMHPLQQVDADRREVHLRLRPNRELFQVLLAFGPDVEVLSPASLREAMALRIAEMRHVYDA